MALPPASEAISGVPHWMGRVLELRRRACARCAENAEAAVVVVAAEADRESDVNRAATIVVAARLVAVDAAGRE